ncbi:MAG TPA: hypothetical protein VM580_32460 [Labilithrix sp.]|nr:hypothetical protein [Labilithrix sp.]
MREVRVVIAFIGIVIAGCFSNNSEKPPPLTFPCEIETILSNRCWECHSAPPAQGVPFSLEMLDDTRKTTSLTNSGEPAPIWQAMAEAIRDKRMPLSAVTFTPDPLPDGERDVMLSWLDQGAPAGERCR